MTRHDSTLRAKVIERQRELGWRDGQMAKALGVPRTSYNAAVKSGTYQISLNLARQIAKTFPDLIPYVLEDEPDLVEAVS